MNDRAVSLLEQYDIEVLRTRKGRGAILCDTNRGFLIFKEYKGSEEKVILQNRLLNNIIQTGKVKVESIVPTKEGSFLVKDNDNISYVLKTYFDGRECNIYNKEECIDAVKVLALLHSCMELSPEEDLDIVALSIESEYEKHNRELKKVKQFLRRKSQKSWFEISLQHTFDYFLDQALEVTEEWRGYSKLLHAKKDDYKRTFCHGDYQYHNILMENQEWCIINFEKCVLDNPIRDLYHLLRKLLEKSNWSIPLGTELLEAYNEVSAISAYSKIDLYYRLAYPEKFWKIVNFYYNSGKAWIPERNQEKLQKLMDQEKEKQHFLDVVFREF